MITLVVGGAHSGKSRYAQTLAEATARPVTYIATATAGDAEMSERIRQHRAERPAHWNTVEEPLALGAALRTHGDGCVIVDCLTLWLSNLVLADHVDAGDVQVIEPDRRFAAERADFLAALRSASGEVIVISNEVGTGLVPLGALNRFYVDQAGLLNQAVAALAGRVVWMVAGCPMCVKGAL
jgi:adenosylcobinamide kinase/adenosylcobinamide-phosphate guanylyltransferase